MEYAQYVGSDVNDTYWRNVDRWKVLNAEEEKNTVDTINVNILTNNLAKFYTLETAITEVPAKNRNPFALICYRTNSGIEYAQYGISETQDVYWNDASRWKVVISGEEEDTNIPDYFNSTDISSSLSVNTQMIPSQTTIGEPTTIDESGNSLINSIKINVVPGDEIVITGMGGSGPRLYYQIGTDNKLLYIANSGSIVENYRLNITQAGVFVINVRNDKPFTIIKNGVVFCLQEDVRKVNDSIRKVNDSILAGNVLSGINYRIGVAVSTKGEEVTGGYPNWATSDFIKNELPIYLNVSDGYYIRFSYYNVEDDSFIKYEDIRTANITVPANSYFKMTPILQNEAEIESVNDILENIKGYLIKPATDTNHKNWYALGDSITDGYISYFDEENNPTSKVDRTLCWATKLAEIRKDLILTNHGVGGEGFLDPAVGTAKDTVDSIDFSNADIVTLAYGINDWKGNQVLGDRTTPDTVLGNMAYCLEKIIGDNPACKIYVLLPLNCCGYSFNYGTEDTNWALGYDGFSNTGTLESFVSKMKEVADYYGIETIDLTHHSVVNRKSLRSLLIDGVHPNAECHAALALELAYKI